ncbi:MAG: hypothetical protein GY765_22110, partial [bacterium]|nr:hypothetical protein [bacterium]
MKEFGRIWFGVLAVVVVFFPYGVYGLDPELPVEDYLMDEWRAGDGLSTDSVINITQTTDGYLWMGTFGGLLRFDGTSFKKIDADGSLGLGETIIFQLYVDRRGALWIASPNGLTRYLEKKFKTFGKTEGLFSTYVNTIFEDVNGNLLAAGKNDCIYSFHRESGTFEKLPPAKNYKGSNIRDIIQDAGGGMWFASGEEGLFKYVNGGFVKFHFKLPRPVEYVGEIQESRSGGLWAVTGRGLVLADISGTSDKKNLLIPSKNSGQAQYRIADLLEDGDGIVWLATDIGLNRVTKDSRGQMQVRALLKNREISCLFEDNKNNLWVGTSGSGLRRFRNPLIKTVTKKDGLPNDNIGALLQDRDGTIWVCTNSGLCRFQDNRFEPVPLVHDGVDMPVSALAVDRDGLLWAAGAKGVIKDPAGNAVYFNHTHGLVADKVTHIYIDTKNRLWVTTWTGVSRYADNTFTSLTTADGLPGDVACAIMEDKNHDIFVTTSGGIIRFPKGELTMDGARVYLP